MVRRVTWRDEYINRMVLCTWAGGDGGSNGFFLISAEQKNGVSCCTVRSWFRSLLGWFGPCSR